MWSLQWLVNGYFLCHVNCIDVLKRTICHLLFCKVAYHSKLGVFLFMFQKLGQGIVEVEKHIGLYYSNTHMTRA